MPASVAHLITPRKLFRLAIKGHSQTGAAASLGVARATLADYLARDPELRRAWEKGLAQDVLEVANAMKTMACEKNNAVAGIFYLKNRDPENWRDKRDVEHSGNVNISVAAPYKTDEIDVTPDSE
jgi:hypothetical protein